MVVADGGLPIGEEQHTAEGAQAEQAGVEGTARPHRGGGGLREQLGVVGRVGPDRRAGRSLRRGFNGRNSWAELWGGCH